ncbi:hypothetical protein B0H10DRAFT_2042103 [Mycena sp. CBHHK59/15]|nr:hypothetical protein B0H10DRAFT_2042103 [Mycena sp. CBHHK59/15]
MILVLCMVCLKNGSATRSGATASSGVSRPHASAIIDADCNGAHQRTRIYIPWLSVSPDSLRPLGFASVVIVMKSP